MRKLATAVAVSLALASTGVKALGLGEIEMHSALNQPLDAEILLNSVGPGELDGLLVQLASREAFDRAGIERAQALGDLRFSVDKKSDGTPFIKIGSRSPVVEPFLNFLLEVDWQKGRMIREYTILLDPPVFMNQEAVSSGADAQAPETVAQNVAEQDLAVPVAIDRDDEALPDIEIVVEEGAAEEVGNDFVINDPADIAGGEEVVIDSVTIEGDSVVTGDEDVFVLDGVRTSETNIPVAETYPNQVDDAMPEVVMAGDEQEVGSATSAPAYASEGVEYTVQRNDTLWEIATSNRPSDVSVQQMMIALLRANQNAFVDNNANRLKAGAILRMPSDSELRSVGRGEAIAEMTEQNRLWQQYRNAFAGSAATTVPATATPDEAATPVSEEAETAQTPSEPVSDETNSVDTAQAPTEPTADETTSAETATADTATPEAPTESGGELNIIAEPDSTESEATINQGDEPTSDNAAIAQVATDISLAQEELAAEQLQKEELLAQADDLSQTNEQMERLIELRENELAQLQSQMAEQGGEMPPAEEPAAEEPVSEAPAEETTPPATVTPPVIEEPVAEATFVEKLLNDPMKLAAAGGVAVLGLLGGLWFLRRRRDDDDEEVVFEATDEDLYEDEVYDEEPEETAYVAAADSDEETVYAGEPAVETEALSDIHDGTDREGLASEEFLEAAVDDEIAKDDTISEADVYLAYGLHGQAEDILTKAVDRDPENESYYVKLLETYHGQKNADRFDEVAGQFHTRFGGDSNPAWPRIAEMGAELNPDNGSYGSGSVAAAAAAGVGAATIGGLAADMFGNDEEEQADSTLATAEAFDETSDTTQIIAPPSGAEELAEPEETSLMDQSIDPGFAFDEADLESTGDFSKIAAELSDELSDEPEAAPEAAEPADGLDFGSLTEAAEDKTSDLGADLAATLAGTAQAAEEVDAGLEFDTTSGFSDDGAYGRLDGDAESIADSANSGLDGLLDEIGDGQGNAGSTRVLGGGSAEEIADAVEEAIEEPVAADDAGLDFDESVLDLSSLENEAEAVDDDLQLAGDSDELTLDLDQLSLDDGQDDNVDGLFDHTETLDTAFDQTQELEIPDLTANADLTASDDSSAFGSTNEMETMLDLAKAYIDMGDNESASSALSEIIKSGNDEQKATAEQLMQKIS